MFYANEVRPAPDLELAPEFSDKEIYMATALMKGLRRRVRPDAVQRDIPRTHTQNHRVKAYEFAPNEFAAIEPQEIKAAEVETSDTIDLFHFVNGADVDPIYFERSYYVAPDSGGEKVYALLLEAMRREECYGIARIGMHRREHMLILRPREDCLVAHTMFYATEIRPAPDLRSEEHTSELQSHSDLVCRL